MTFGHLKKRRDKKRNRKQSPQIFQIFVLIDAEILGVCENVYDFAFTLLKNFKKLEPEKIPKIAENLILQHQKLGIFVWETINPSNGMKN